MSRARELLGISSESKIDMESLSGDLKFLHSSIKDGNSRSAVALLSSIVSDVGRLLIDIGEKEVGGEILKISLEVAKLLRKIPKKTQESILPKKCLDIIKSLDEGKFSSVVDDIMKTKFVKQLWIDVKDVYPKADGNQHEEAVSWFLDQIESELDDILKKFKKYSDEDGFWDELNNAVSGGLS